jgi:hypothetical protein
MLTIENKHELIQQRIQLSGMTYYILNKTHSDIKIVLNRFKTGKGYILWNENGTSSMLLSSEQIKSKQTFLKAIELVMIMK